MNPDQIREAPPTLEDYARIVEDNTRSLGDYHFQRREGIYSLSPFRRVAICPFCGQEYLLRLQRWGLEEWLERSKGLGGHIFHYDPKQGGRGFKGLEDFGSGPPCPHFVHVQFFLNLGNRPPRLALSEARNISDFVSHPEVPYFAAPLMERWGVKAVLASHPVSVWDQGGWRDTYQGFTVVYFAPQPPSDDNITGSPEYRKCRTTVSYETRPYSPGDHTGNNVFTPLGDFRNKKELYWHGRPVPGVSTQDGEDDPALLGTGSPARHWYDAGYWIDRGQLGWMTPEETQVWGPRENFPWKALPGRRTPLIMALTELWMSWNRREVLWLDWQAEEEGQVVPVDLGKIPKGVQEFVVGRWYRWTGGLPPPLEDLEPYQIEKWEYKNEGPGPSLPAESPAGRYWKGLQWDFRGRMNFVLDGKWRQCYTSKMGFATFLHSPMARLYDMPWAIAAPWFEESVEPPPPEDCARGLEGYTVGRWYRWAGPPLPQDPSEYLGKTWCGIYFKSYVAKKPELFFDGDWHQCIQVYENDLNAANFMNKKSKQVWFMQGGTEFIEERDPEGNNQSPRPFSPAPGTPGVPQYQDTGELLCAGNALYLPPEFRGAYLAILAHYREGRFQEALKACRALIQDVLESSSKVALETMVTLESARVAVLEDLGSREQVLDILPRLLEVVRAVEKSPTGGITRINLWWFLIRYPTLRLAQFWRWGQEPDPQGLYSRELEEIEIQGLHKLLLMALYRTQTKVQTRQSIAGSCETLFEMETIYARPLFENAAVHVYFAQYLPPEETSEPGQESNPLLVQTRERLGLLAIIKNNAAAFGLWSTYWKAVFLYRFLKIVRT